MKKYRHLFNRGIDIVNDKALTEGAVSVCENIDLRSGSPRPMDGIAYEKAASNTSVSLFRYRGRYYESDEYRVYSTDRIGGRDVVYFSRDGKYPAKFVEGKEAPVGTKAPSLSATATPGSTASSTVKAEQTSGGIFKKDAIRSYRVGVETLFGVMPPGPRAIVKFTTDSAAVDITWTVNPRAQAYLIFAGDEGEERLLARVAATITKYQDTGITSAFGELASSYDAQNPYTYCYTFFRDISGVTNESGPSPLSAQVTPSNLREIRFDVVGDGFFDQIGVVEIKDGITVQPTDLYFPRKGVLSWAKDPSQNRIIFETKLPHTLSNEDTVRFFGFTDREWNEKDFPVVVDAVNDRKFYVTNRPAPTDPIEYQTFYGSMLISTGALTYGFDDGTGSAATAIDGTPEIYFSPGSTEPNIVLSPVSHTNHFPWSEPSLSNFTNTSNMTNATSLFEGMNINGVRGSAVAASSATLDFTPDLNHEYEISCYAYVSPTGTLSDIFDSVRFVVGGDDATITSIDRIQGGDSYRIAATFIKGTNTSNQTGIKTIAPLTVANITFTRFVIRKSPVAGQAGYGLKYKGRYIKTTGAAASAIDYTLVNAIVTLGRSSTTNPLADQYKVPVLTREVQKVVSRILISPTPAKIPVTDDAVWMVINGVGGLYRAKGLTDSTFEINAWTPDPSTCTLIKFVPNNGFLTHRYLYRTGDTSGWNLVEKIPIWTSNFTDYKSFNYLGDPPDSFYRENGVDVIFFAPPNGMSFIRRHGDMLFGIDSNKVRWTPVDRPDAWPEVFYYAFEGKPIALESYGQSLIVLCDDAIYRIDGTVPTALTRTGTRAQDGCIAPNSVQRTNAGLIYLSRRGLMAFDGMDAKCITDTRIPGSAIYGSGNLDGPSNHFVPTKYTINYQALSSQAVGSDWSILRVANEIVTAAGYIKDLRSFYVDGKYYLYATSSSQNYDGNTMWCIDLEAPGAPITTVGLRPLDVCVDADETTYMLLGNAGDQDAVFQNMDEAIACQLNFWQEFTPTSTSGNGIYKFNTNAAGYKLPWFIRLGANSCGDPFERKKFRSVELHTTSTATGALSFRVWIDGNYVCDGRAVGSEGSTQPRKVNIPQGRQLGYNIDIELAGVDAIRGLEINYDSTSQPSR